ncbi:MAG: O-antigen ligase family protein, partial [Alphaproteobacteria bacterium]
MALPALVVGAAVIDPRLLLVPGLVVTVGALGLWVAVAGLRLSLEGLRRAFALPGATAIVLVLAALLVGGLLPDIAQRSARDVVEQPFNAANVLRAGLLGLAGLWALGAFGLNSSGDAGGWRVLTRPPHVFYLVFAMIAVSSAIYASNALASLAKSIEILVMAFVMGAIAYRVGRRPDHAFEHALGLWNLTIGLLALALLALLFGTLADPEAGLQRLPGAFLPVRLIGAWLQIHPNTSGQLGAVLVVVGLNRCLRLRRSTEVVYWFGLVALGLVVLVLAQARTSVIALMIAVPAVLFLNRRPILGVTFGLVSLLGTSLQAQVLSDYLLRGQSAEQFMTGSGRANIWQAAWTLFETSPMIGLGFYTSVRLDLTARYGVLDLSNADNTLLEVLVGVGIVGAIPFVLFVGSFVRRVLG